MHIIGLMGAEQAGKSTVARALKEFGFRTMTLADPLKRMLAAGFSELTYDHLYGARKEEPVRQLQGKTTRFAMQTVGTEWGRKLIGNNVWSDLCGEEMDAIERGTPGRCYLFEDVRFPNEIDLIRSRGGEIWLVRRPAVEPNMAWWMQALRYVGGIVPFGTCLGLPQPLHASSTEWARMRNPEVTFYNTSTKSNYALDISEAILAWAERHEVDLDVGQAEAAPVELCPLEITEPAPPAIPVFMPHETPSDEELHEALLTSGQPDERHEVMIAEAMQESVLPQVDEASVPVPEATPPAPPTAEEVLAYIEQAELPPPPKKARRRGRPRKTGAAIPVVGELPQGRPA